MRTSKAYRLLNIYISLFLAAMLIISSTLIYGGWDTFAAEDKKAEQTSENNKSGEGDKTAEPTKEEEKYAGWVQFDGLWYYYNDEGTYLKSCYIDGYWLDADGALRYPYRAYWQGGAGNWWYGDDSGWYAYDCWLNIDEKWYYFDSMGYMCYNCFIGGCYVDDNGAYRDTENTRWAYNLSSSELAGYFGNTVVVGDSICDGFRMYCSGSGDPVAQQFTFMTNTSFGINNALVVSSTTPVYQGVRRPIWESIYQSGASHVIISMGMNDIASDIFDTQYESLINRIKQYSPGIKVTICSVTGVKTSGQRGYFTNSYVNWQNKRIRSMCARNGYGFIDLNSWTTDGYGLYSGYCSDGFVHQNSASYSRWLEAFKSYGRAELVKRYE